MEEGLQGWTMGGRERASRARGDTRGVTRGVEKEEPEARGARQDDRRKDKQKMGRSAKGMETV